MCRQVYYKHHQIKISSKDRAPQQLQFLYIFHHHWRWFFLLSKNKIKKRTHIHFITRVEMKLFVVIADSNFRSLGRFFFHSVVKMRVIQFFGSIIIWWWFSVLPIMDFYETFYFLYLSLLLFFCYSLPVLHFKWPKEQFVTFFFYLELFSTSMHYY